MQYNKEIFNSSSQPKGILSFDKDKLDQEDLEELQRQWVSMFRGVKGMWRTPFLQYGAKWQPIAPSNRDMEFSQYVQVLSSWICAIHGIDSAEMGLKFDRTQNVLNENPEARIAYSKSRGLKDLLNFHESIFNKIMWEVPEWKEFQFEFVGLEARDQKAELEVDEKQTQVYMTINEKRKEKDMQPIKGGDIINNPQFLQALSMEQQESMGGGEGGGDMGGSEGQPAGGDEGGGGLFEEGELEGGDMEKSFKNKKESIEVITE